MQTDENPEGGASWEQFVFGGHITRSATQQGLLVCEDFTHIYPAELPVTLPIAAPVPVQHAEEWFLKDTWNSSRHNFEDLRLPTIRQQTTKYLTTRFSGRDFHDNLYHRGVSQSEVAVEHLSAVAVVLEEAEIRPGFLYRLKHKIGSLTKAMSMVFDQKVLKQLDFTSRKLQISSSGQSRRRSQILRQFGNRYKTLITMCLM
jgi:hypothetical protein